MKIKSLQITSASTLDLELKIEKPICVLCGEHSDLALDLLRELIGDDGAKNDPNRFDDGQFVIHSHIEMDGKKYQVCYIRNADFIGDNRIAANFSPNSLDFSTDDTIEFMQKCVQRNKDLSNILCELSYTLNKEDDRPVFIYLSDFAGKAILTVLDALARTDRQVFVAVDANHFECNDVKVQTVFVR